MPPDPSDLIRGGYEALNRRDIDAIIALLDDSISMRMAMDPTGEYPPFDGKVGARRMVEQLLSGFRVFEAELHSVDDIGERTRVARGDLRIVTHDDQEMRVPFCQVWRVEGDKIVGASFHDAANPLALMEGEGTEGPLPDLR